MDTAAAITLENKNCFISILIDGRMLHFRGVRVVKDSDSVIVFLDKDKKIRSYNRMLVQEAYEL